jgi:D-3-phosphoglycerate dehydrogenase
MKRRKRFTKGSVRKMSSRKIFIALSTFAKEGRAPLTLLEESGISFAVNPLGKRLEKHELIEMAQGCQGVVAGLELYDHVVLSQLLSLKCISRCGVGVDNIDLVYARQQGVEVRNTPNVVVQPVAELTLGMILDLLKKITFHTFLLRQNQWQRLTGSLLQGKCVGVLGLGRIGRRVAELLTRLEAEVIGADLYPDAKWASEQGVEIVSIPELLRRSDIVTIHLAEVVENPFQITSREIALMKKGALLVNVARGRFICEDDLFAALQEGRLGGAALDVFSQEPYTGPLCSLENVILTPHVATLTQESRMQMEWEAVKNLIQYFQSIKEKPSQPILQKKV